MLMDNFKNQVLTIIIFMNAIAIFIMSNALNLAKIKYGEPEIYNLILIMKVAIGDNRNWCRNDHPNCMLLQ